MTPFAAFSLLIIMLGLAAMPSASVALVVTRSATGGFRHGVAVAAGVVLGDLVFVALALLGMSFLAETMGAFFAVLKLAGGTYLIWLGISLLRTRSELSVETSPQRPVSMLTSFAAGFLLTLGDVKAIFFYASLFPTVVELSTLSTTDVLAIVLVTLLAVGGVKLVYAFLAQRIVRRIQNRRMQTLARTTAGGLMIGAGSYLIVKA
ncbi:MAG: LysE family translocator [Puniceicoccaceae bacterium]